MPEQPPHKPPSPFAPAPSAHPPSAPGAPRPVRVSAPMVESESAALPLSRVITDAPGSRSPPLLLLETHATEPAGLPQPARVPDAEIETRPMRPTGRMVGIVGGTTIALVLAVLGLRALLARHDVHDLASSASADGGRSTSSVSSSAPAASVPSPDTSSNPVPTATGPAAPLYPPGPFDRAAARAALDALAAEVTDCKVPRRRPCRVTITFAPDGTVSSANALPPYRGTAAGICVATHLKDAHITPFRGRASSYVYTFVRPM